MRISDWSSDVCSSDLDANGNVDVEDIRARAAKHADRLAAIMITYPSTHGVFEEDVVEICEIVHKHGGQVYTDGANMRSEERRVGKDSDSTWRSRWTPDHYKKN